MYQKLQGNVSAKDNSVLRIGKIILWLAKANSVSSCDETSTS